jgi:hypothetical protein
MGYTPEIDPFSIGELKFSPASHPHQPAATIQFQTRAARADMLPEILPYPALIE